MARRSFLPCRNDDPPQSGRPRRASGFSASLGRLAEKQHAKHPQTRIADRLLETRPTYLVSRLQVDDIAGWCIRFLRLALLLALVGRAHRDRVFCSLPLPMADSWMDAPLGWLE